MHQSSLDKMRAFRNEYLKGRENERLTIVDLGSCDVNDSGSYKHLFDSENWNYIGVDVSPGKNVDIVLKNPYSWEEIQSNFVDVLISGQAFEHIEYFWITMLEISRVLKPDGICCIIAPSSGPEHRYPVDCWRFYPDGFRALALFAKLDVISVKTQWENLSYSDGSDDFHDSMLICRKPISSSLASSKTEGNVMCDLIQPEREDVFRYYAEQPSHLKILSRMGIGKKILEIGCSTGYITKILKENLNCRVTAIEIDQEAASHAGKYCERLIVGDAEHIDYKQHFEGENFDVILFGDVLEHMKYPDRVLTAVKGLLTNDGYIVASIPNIAHASIITELLDGKFDYSEFGLLDKTHLRFFTRESVYRLLESSGYIVDMIDIVYSPYERELKAKLQDIPEDIVEYIYSHNKDAETYQFIVKAFPSTEAGYISKLKHQLKDVETNAKNLELAIKDKNVHMINIENHNRGLEAAIEDKDNHINNLEAIIRNKDVHIENLGTHIKNVEAVIRDKGAHIFNLESRASGLDDQVKNLETRIKNLETAIKDKDNHIRNIEALLKERETTLNNIYKSRGWKALIVYYKLKARILGR